MHDVVFASGWDTAIIMVPFIGMMALAMFGLDEKLAAPKRPKRSKRGFSHLDRRGSPFVFDPDGEGAASDE